MADSLNDEIRELDAEAEKDRARDPVAARKKAMDLLARREHAADELTAKLEKSGFEADTASEAVARLGEEGLQSDARFVESFIQSRISQGKGPQRIRAELRQRGVTETVVDRAIGQASVDWYDLARETRERKFGRDLPREFKEKARQMRFLQYRGFEPDHIQAAVGGS
jgi:regulatory protein